MRRGRPLRFLGTTLGLWVSVRLMILWPQIDDLATLRDALIPPVAALAIARAEPPSMARAARPAPGRERGSSPRQTAPADPPLAAVIPAPGPSPSAPQLATVRTRLGVALPPPLATAPRRWAASAWLILRGDHQSAPYGQLGGAQAGLRLTYALGTRRRVALALRLSGPLHARGTEIAPGIDWQPGKAPIHLIAEHRIAIDGGRGGPAVLVVAGLNPTPIGGHISIEAYGQAGAVAHGDVAGFADGAARIFRPVATIDGAEVDLGIAAWGGIQPGVARLDIGPAIAVAIPVGNHRVRLSLDWRQRIAGRAAPASGPALSIGSDF